MSQIQAKYKQHGHLLQCAAVCSHLPAMPGDWTCMPVLSCSLPFQTDPKLSRNCPSWPRLGAANQDPAEPFWPTHRGTKTVSYSLLLSTACPQHPPARPPTISTPQLSTVTWELPEASGKAPVRGGRGGAGGWLGEGAGGYVCSLLTCSWAILVLTGHTLPAFSDTCSQHLMHVRFNPEPSGNFREGAGTACVGGRDNTHAGNMRGAGEAGEGQRMHLLGPDRPGASSNAPGGLARSNVLCLGAHKSTQQRPST
jgi:hypothetical protein